MAIRFGTPFDDILIGTNDADILIGRGGDDRLEGLGGNDLLLGGFGNDELLGGDGDDLLFGGFGNDELLGGDGDDLLFGGFGRDLLVGGLGADHLFGGVGEDELDGGDGDDELEGGVGDDELRSGDGQDRLDGGPGNDSLFGNDGLDTLVGGPGNDLLDGGLDFAIFQGFTLQLFNDIADYSDDPGPVTANLAAGTASDGFGGTDMLVDIEGVVGSGFADTLIGGSGFFDQLTGGPGNDFIDGGGGVASQVDYSTDPSSVTVDLAAGTATDGFGDTDTLLNIDFVEGSAFADTLLGSNASFETFRGNAGDDFIDGRGGTDEVSYTFSPAGVTVDLVAGTALDGFGDSDTFINVEGVRGSFFDDTLIGGDPASDSSEFFIGMAGNDFIDGGSGFDEVNYGQEAVLGGTGAVTVDLAAGSAVDGFGDTDTLIDIERVVGTSFADILMGGGTPSNGFETFRGGDGADFIDGRAGFDRVEYTDAPARVTVDLAAGTGIDGFGNVDSLVSIEGVRGSNFADVLSGGGDPSFERFDGRGGDDAIDGRAGFDEVEYGFDPAGVTADLGAGTASDGFGGTDTLAGIEAIRGSLFADSLTGGADDSFERFRGLAGNDTIDGATGVDRADYSADALFGGSAGVTVDLAAGMAVDGFGDTDTLLNIEQVRGTDFADSLTGDASGNVLIGLSGNDQIFGNGGGDILFGGFGADMLDGGDQVDFLIGGPGDDVLMGGNGFDLVDYANDPAGVTADLSANTAVDGFGDTDTLLDIEQVRGSNFADVISGDSGSNSLFSGGGADTLNSGPGADFLDGGLGDDLFVFENGADANSIGGFSAGALTEDVIDITDFGFAGFAAVQAAATQDGANTVIKLDADDQVILLGVQVTDLHPDDFLI